MAQEHERFAEWHERISRAERRVQFRAARWQKFLEQYRNRASGFAGDLPLTSPVWVNYLFGQIRVAIPSIYAQNPDIFCRPRGKTPDVYAHLLTKLLNYQFEEVGVELETRRCILDSFITGFSPMRLGYDPALRRKRRVRNRPETEDFLTVEDIYETELDDFVAQAETLDYVHRFQHISNVHPFAFRMPPRHFLIDPFATSLEDAYWIGFKNVYTVDELKKNRRYPRTLTLGIRGTANIEELNYLNAVEGFYDLHDLQMERELVVLYEIWDRETDRFYVLDSYHMGEGDKRFLRTEKNPYRGMDGFPCELLVFNPDPDTPFGISDAEQWENPIKTMNLVNHLQFIHANRFNRKYVYDKTRLTEPEEIAKFQSAEDGTAFGVNGSPVDAVLPLQDAPLSPDVYALRETLRQELAFLSGVTPERRGDERTRSGKTATEASIRDYQSRVREGDRQYVVTRFFIQNIARKFLQLDREFLDPFTVSFLTNEEEANLWLALGPEIIKAEVDVAVRIGTSAYVSREVRVKQLLDFQTIYGAQVNPTTGMPILNTAIMARKVGEAMGIDDLNDILTPEPNAMPPAEQGMLNALLGGATPKVAPPQTSPVARPGNIAGQVGGAAATGGLGPEAIIPVTRGMVQ